MIEHRDNIFETAAENIKVVQLQQKKIYDERHINNFYIKVGDIVGLKNQQRCGRKVSKDEARFNVLYQAVAPTGKSAFYLKNLKTSVQLKASQSATSLKSGSLEKTSLLLMPLK